MARLRGFHDIALPLLPIIGSYASVLGLLFPLLQRAPTIEWWMLLLSGVIIALALLHIGMFLNTRRGYRAYKIDDRLGIRKYMRRWIRDGRRVVIWTRDMTWAEDSDTESLLVEKAKSGDLIICLPKSTDMTNRLEVHGAQVFAHNALEPPATSFTIVNYKRDGSRVAVGSRRGDLHLIQEFSADDSPIFHMAIDIVTLAMSEHRSAS